MKFGDVVMATASAMVIYVLIGFPLHLALTSPLGYFWGSLVGSVIAFLITGVVVGYVYAGKIWEENRLRTIGEIAVLAAVLIAFAVTMETAAYPHWGVWMQAQYEAENPGAVVAETDWYFIEGMMLSRMVFINMVLVLVLGYVGVFVGSMFKKPVKS